MASSYKPLWHLLVEREMNKEDLKRAANITSNIVSKMIKNSYVNLKSLEKIYLALDCRIEDVLDFGSIADEWLDKRDYKPRNGFLDVKAF